MFEEEEESLKVNISNEIQSSIIDKSGKEKDTLMEVFNRLKEDI